MFSKRLYDIITSNLTPKDAVSWLETTISNIEEKRLYYIPVFNLAIDILDMENTLFVAGTDQIMLPCISLKKAREYNIFPRPRVNEVCYITSAIYVSEKLRKAIMTANISEIKFEKAKTK